MSSVSAVNTLLSGTTTNTPSINISSILAATSGNTAALDVTAAVAAGIYADRAPERVWQADQTTFTSQTTALTAIQTATTSVTNDLASLNTLTGPLAARTVTSSSSDVTATAATGTVAGNHVVVVNSLASTGAWYSSLETGPTETLPSSSITINTAKGPTTIATGTGAVGDTLNDLSNAINGDDLGITASVVSDSTGSRLAIISNTSGSAADFSISESFTSWTAPVLPSGETLGANSILMTSATSPATTATIATTSGENYTQLAAAINAISPSLGVTATETTDGSGNQSLTITSNATTPPTPFTINEPSASGSAFSFTQATVGANASLTVDGVPISSASNTVTGAISGVTLTLLGAAPAVPVDLTVASDATQVSTAINQFVTDYNTAIGLVNAQFTIGSAGTEGVLGSDSTVSNLQSTMEQALNFTATPATGTTTVSTLNDLGITMGTDGTLSVDTTTLNDALTNNPGDVQNFFQGAALNGFANSMGNALTTYTDPSTGAFTVDLAGISSSSANITSQINSFETNYIANQQTVLTAEYSSAEVALQQLPAEMANIQAELGNTGGKNS